MWLLHLQYVFKFYLVVQCTTTLIKIPVRCFWDPIKGMRQSQTGLLCYWGVAYVLMM